MKRLILLIGFFYISNKVTHAQPGKVDPSFGINGTVLANILSLPGLTQYKIGIIQADGKLLVMGETNINSKYSVVLARYNKDGSLDSSFSEDGKVIGDSFEYYSIAIQKDGKIVLAGSAVTRYNTDGSLDTNFSGGHVVIPSFSFSAIAVQNDGKIIVAGVIGDSDPYIQSQDFAIARFNTNGTLDKSFSKDGKVRTDIYVNDEANSIVIQTDGKILVGGNSYTNYKEYWNYLTLVRYTVDGFLDTSFNKNGIVQEEKGDEYSSITSIFTQKEGKIVIVEPIGLQRFNYDGKLDSNFALAGKLQTSLDGLALVYFQNDGKFLLTNFEQSDSDFVVSRYNADGILDTSFSEDGVQEIQIPKRPNIISHLMVNNSQIYVVGFNNSFPYNDYGGSGIVHRYGLGNGIDTSYGNKGLVKTDFGSDRVSTNFTSLALQNDGKIIIVGTAINDSSTDFVVARFNTDGSFDNTFNNDGIQSTGFGINQFIQVSSVAIQSDGKIVVLGTIYDKLLYLVVRYNTDGSLDTTFGNKGVQTKYFIYYSVANSLALQNDGKIVVVGYAGGNIAVIRYNRNGTLDTTFNGNGEQLTQVTNGNRLYYSVAIQSNGKILVAGTTGTGANEVTEHIIVVRYNSDGSIDNTFGDKGIQITIFSDIDLAESMALQADGKILVAGSSYHSFSNKTEYFLVRFNSNGTIDSTFGNNGKQMSYRHYTNAYATSVVVESNGNILVGGFVAKGGRLYRAFTNYYSNGDVNPNFDNEPKETRYPNYDFSKILVIAKGRFYFVDNNSSKFGIVSRYFLEHNKAPIINLTNPTNNVVYIPTATITLNATAIDPDGTITSVQFYNGSTLIAVDSTIPYRFSINNMPIGNYSFVAKATDNNKLTGNSATVFVSMLPAPNTAPVIKIIQPVQNATYSSPATIKLNSTATDPDGTISSVQFFNGSTLLKKDSSDPYSYTMNNAAPGTYKFYAKAIDNKGASNSSATVSVFVMPGTSNKAPVIRLINPVNNEIHYAPGTVYINVLASDEDGIVKNVKFYMGSILLSTDTISPYTFTATNLPVGNYTIVAKATDNKGMESNSATAFVPVLVAPNKAPIVSLLSPVNNASYYATASITLSATASDPDGTISNVKFFNGSTLVKTDSTTPYSYTVNNISQGYYRFYAKATDNKGLSNSSATVYAVVQPKSTCNITSQPTFGLKLNGRPIANTNNGIYDSSECGSVTVCDGESYLMSEFTHSSSLNLYNITFTIQNPGWIYLDGITPQDTVLTAAQLTSLAGAHTLYLEYSHHGSSFMEHITPFIDINKNLILDYRDCVGDPIVLTLTAKPCYYNGNLVSSKSQDSENKIKISDSATTKIWPNPANDILNIYTTGLQANKKQTISILSVSGQVLKNIQGNSSSHRMEINISSLPSGLYIIKVASADKVIYRQFVKL